jgi:hypothetical protein
MKRLLFVLILSFLLVGCQEKVQIVPPWHAPWQDHTLECMGDHWDGECSHRPWPSAGPL